MVKKELFNCYIVKPNGSLTKDEWEKTNKVFGMLMNDSGHILETFLNLYMPGFKITDPLTSISPLLASRNPGALFNHQILKQAPQKV